MKQSLVGKDRSTNIAATQRLPVSAFIVCCNEEDHIAECLESLSFCDEVIVIDSFSSDNTPKIAEKFGAKVIQRAWPGYKEQKAFGLSTASNEWVLNLDADERVTPELKEEILQVLELAWKAEQEGKGPQADGYEVSRVVHYMGRWWRKGGWYPEFRVRLVRKSKTVWGGNNPHEKPIVSGTIKRLDGELSHYTYEDLYDHIEKLRSHALAAAKEEISNGTKPTLSLLIFNPLVRFFKFYFLKLGYKEGIAGFIVAVLEGYYTFIKYALVWERSHKVVEQDRINNQDKAI